MKPQCTTAAQCLKELARVMEQFGINDSIAALNSNFVKYAGECGGWSNNFIPPFKSPDTWQFAIAEVEGKPVFIGDELYDQFGDLVICSAEDVRDWTKCSWNPPRPTTVMVELTVEDAENLARDANERLAGTYAYDRVGLACKTALEKLKS